MFSFLVSFFRILEIFSSKIFSMLKEDIRLDSLNSVTSTKSYRIEEVPRDELNLSSDEALVPVAHFHREMFATFGMPFLFKIKDVSNITEVLSLLCLPYFHVHYIWALTFSK